MNEQNLNTLKELLAVNTTTWKEEPMVAWLVDYIVRNIKGATITVDAHKNVFVTKGKAKFYPTVAAHIDSVQPYRSVSIQQSGTRLFGIDTSCNKQCGIGADDKTGVFVCLRLLHEFDAIKVAFFATEEHGMVGASKADPQHFKKMGYLIEYDCPSRNMVSYSCASERLFVNDGDFIRAAHPILVKHGSTLWQDHPYTDVTMIRKRFPITCLNLSSGYYNWHAPHEFASIPDIDLCLELSIDLIRTLDSNHFPAPVGRIAHVDKAPPLCEIGYLHVPDALP